MITKDPLFGLHIPQRINARVGSGVRKRVLRLLVLLFARPLATHSQQSVIDFCAANGNEHEVVGVSGSPRYVTLPVVIQDKYQTYLSGAGPLCIMLANGYDTWFLEHFVQMRSRRTDNSRDQFATNLSDIFAYSSVAETYLVDRGQAHDISSASEFLQDRLREGFYVTMFVDDHYLRGLEEPRVHEFVFFGYDKSIRRLNAIGFRNDRRLGQLDFSFDDIDRAYARGIECMSASIVAVAQLIRPMPIPAEPFDHEAFSRRLRAYLESRPTDEDLRYKTWWSESSHSSFKNGQIYGINTYDHFIKHFQEIVRSPRDPSYSADYLKARLLFEHKKMLLDRLRYVSRVLNFQEAVSTELRDLNDLGLLANRYRLGMLAHVMHPSKTWVYDMPLLEMKDREHLILTRFCRIYETYIGLI